MGRGKHCTEEKREIKKIYSEGKTYAEIGQIHKYSNKMIRNALVYMKKSKPMEENHPCPTQLIGKEICPRKQKRSV